MNSEIDLRDRLRFAADSLAADVGDSLTARRPNRCWRCRWMTSTAFEIGSIRPRPAWRPGGLTRPGAENRRRPVLVNR